MRKITFYLLLLALLIACKSQPPVEPEFAEIKVEAEEEPVIDIWEPEFSIVSIAIIKADLINTQFEAVIKIDNHNEFALDLSLLNYELYGNGKFWADGKVKDILHIPALSSRETEFRFIMNFINMNRRLLDDVIAKRRVNYRFKGNAEVETGFSHVQPFTANFEQTGFSEVK